MHIFRRFWVFFIILVFAMPFVFANENDTIPVTLNITGNLPTSTIFLSVAGEEETGFINLAPNSTTLVSCWGVADDLDGLDDIVSLESVLYSDSTTRFSDLNESILYRNNSCDTSTMNLDGFWNCTFLVQYYAEPAEWSCAINLTNTDPLFYNDAINTTSTIEELIALSLANTTIDFGVRAVGVNYNADTEVVVFNEGNVPLDLLLDAFNETSSLEDNSNQAFSCDVGFIPIDLLRISLVFDDEFDNSLPMVAEGQAFQLFGLMPRQGGTDNHLPTLRSTYWATGIPQGVAGTCRGRIMYIGQSQ